MRESLYKTDWLQMKEERLYLVTLNFELLSTEELLRDEESED